MTTIALIAALTLAAPALKEPPKRANDIVGEWVMESSVYNGRPRTNAAVAMRMVFKADGTWIYYRGERKINGDRAYRVDTTVNPPAITLKYEPAEQFGSEALGIYKVEGDRLTLCYGRGGIETRPTEFASPEGALLNLMVFKRVKPKD
jgi:uncharacterized protein (TIGR03067 family)